MLHPAIPLLQAKYISTYVKLFSTQVQKAAIQKCLAAFYLISCLLDKIERTNNATNLGKFIDALRPDPCRLHLGKEVPDRPTKSQQILAHDFIANIYLQ